MRALSQAYNFSKNYFKPQAKLLTFRVHSNSTEYKIYASVEN